MTKIEKIAKLVEFTLTAPKEKNLVVNLGELKPHEVVAIEKTTGIDLTGYIHVIDRFAVGHTLKVHGDEKEESLRGQIAVTPADFKKIPRILKSDNIIYQGKNSKGLDCILYEAVIGSIFYYVVEVRTKRKHLAMATMYKRKPRKK